MRDAKTIIGVVLIMLLLVVLLSGVGTMGFGSYSMSRMMIGNQMHGLPKPLGLGVNSLGTTIPLAFLVLMIGGGVLLALWLGTARDDRAPLGQ